MFRRDTHRAMQSVLEAFDVGALEDYRVALGGATRIALAFGEPRESRDLDFLGSDAGGWTRLRTAVSARGYSALFRDPSALALPREPSADQYGIRFPVVALGMTLKVEIIREARIELLPAVHVSFCTVPCLAIEDCYTEKLLANADRGADPSQLDRDVVDLAILRSKHGPIPTAALEAATKAYGPSVRDALSRSVQRFRGDAARRARDVRGLRVDDEPMILSGIELLAADLALPEPGDDDRG